MIKRLLVILCIYAVTDALQLLQRNELCIVCIATIGLVIRRGTAVKILLIMRRTHNIKLHTLLFTRTHYPCYRLGKDANMPLTIAIKTRILFRCCYTSILILYPLPVI